MHKLLNLELLKRTITGLFLAVILIYLILYAPFWLFTLSFLFLLIAIITVELTRLINPKKLSYWLILPIYPILPFLLIIFLQKYSSIYTLYLFASVAAFDSGSYIFGKLFGNHKMCPAISPGKSWEGFAGGYAAALLVTYLFSYYIQNFNSITFIILFSLILSVFSLIGDLFESYLKRRAGVKDSGNLLPGHGGLLDRFDGILFAVIPVSLINFFF